MFKTFDMWDYSILGAGDFYCSGNDLGNFMNIPPDGVKAMAEQGGVILE
jgi:peroxisomal 3,2-trans-enoyl-CoA isomerase